MHEVLVNRLGGLSLPRKSVVRLTDSLDMTLDVYHGRKTTTQQQKMGAHKIINIIALKIVKCGFKCSEAVQRCWDGKIRSRSYKTFFMLNTAEHGI